MHLIILAWGFTGILGKLIQLDFYQIVFFRVIIAGLSLLFYLLIAKKQVVIKNKKDVWRVVGVGLLVTAHWLAFYRAIQVSTASVGVLCLSTTTLHVSWIEPLVMKRKFSWIEFFLGLLVIVGIVFVAGNIEASQIEGIFWGLAAAICAALFSVFNLKLKREGIPSASITLYEMLTGAIALFAWLLFIGRIEPHFFIMSSSDFYWLIFLGIICTSAAFVLMIEVVNKIGAFSASLSINLEPVYSIILAIFILHENELLGGRFYLGAIFIVVVVFANPLIKYSIEKSTKTRVPRMMR